MRSSLRARQPARLAVDVQTLDPPALQETPLERLQSAETMQMVRRQISVLPERQREALVLYAFDQMSYREIAQVLDLPANSVKTLIHRARAALAAAIERQEEKP